MSGGGVQRVSEREVTFDVDESWSMPELTGILSAGSQVESTTAELEATYYDTETAILRRLGVTLRRRRGGSDAGWHLKVPSGGARTEFRSQARSDTIPVALSRRLAGLLAGRTLHPVATINTTRRVTRLIDEAGQLLLEVADDTVVGTSADDQESEKRWREVEAELGPAGEEADLEAVSELFEQSGARPVAGRLKLDRLLGSLPDTPESGEAAELVASYVREQCTAILLGDVGLRDKPEPEAVHKTRVGVRRLRSTLRNFGEVLDPALAEPATKPDGADGQDDGAFAAFDNDLRWFAGLFGPIRDDDILSRRLNRELDELPPSQIVGPVRLEISRTLAAERAAAVDQWREATDDARYERVMATLCAWVSRTPVGDASALDSGKVLKKARRKAKRRLAQANGDPDELHRARKAAKRARYTADLLTPAVPGAKKAAKQAKKIQTKLGDHQDLAVAANFLRRMADQKGRDGYTYGVLTSRVDQQAAEIRAQLAEA
jgi:CHAD domain-containing protein